MSSTTTLSSPFIPHVSGALPGAGPPERRQRGRPGLKRTAQLLLRRGWSAGRGQREEADGWVLGLPLRGDGINLLQ